ncbi:hypothetical protein CBR_g56521, partial [Chara braunii]
VGVVILVAHAWEVEKTTLTLELFCSVRRQH